MALRVFRRLAALGALTLGLVSGLALSPAAQAVPSFARQTGSECAACHIGAFGSHLTPHGIRFKIGGYVESDGKGTKVPLSAQITASYNKPANGPSDTRVGQVDLYLAGRLADSIGAYVSVQHTEGANQVDTTMLNDLDIRFAREVRLGDKPLTWGLTLNNNPTITDPIDALPAWGWGAFGLGRDPAGTRTGSLINKYQGGLARRVLGATAYALYDNHWYAELGTYRSLSLDMQDKLGVPAAGPSTVGDVGRLGGNTAYWRAAYMHDFKTQFFSIGLVGLHTSLQPGPQRLGPSDRVRDLGVDMMYEYLGTREHVVQVRASYIRERRNYGSSPANPLTGAPSLPTGTLDEKTFSATYAHRSGGSLQLARTWTHGSRDFGRYTFYGAPDTQLTFINPYWTVWGQEDSPVPAGFNLQLGAVWLRWDKVNTSSTQVFGPFVPLNAKDFNALAVYARLTY